jgi:Tfp pilus assembly protein PilX
MNKKQKEKNRTQISDFRYSIFDAEGVTLYVALAVTGALLLIGVAVINITVKQLTLSASARDSQVAFFAADSGTECALYWDLKITPNPFSTTTSPIPSVSCTGSSVTPTRAYSGGIATSTFSFQDPCINITVVKSYSGGSLKTKIESRGYNSCNLSDPRRVERAILINY